MSGKPIQNIKWYSNIFQCVIKQKAIILNELTYYEVHTLKL